MIRETLGTLRSDNGDTNENVAEKSGPMKLFPLPIYQVTHLLERRKVRVELKRVPTVRYYCFR